jgi:predicted NBD/HSP70 family sugar kinase
LSGVLRAGLDIGGTKTDAVTVLPDGSIGQRLRLRTGYGPAAVIDTAVAALEQLAALSGVTVGRFASIGVGIPGAVDPAAGRVQHAVNLGLDDLGLGGDLLTRLGRTVRVENDVNAAALGAFQLLDQRPGQSMAYLNLGTGLAVGVVLGGQLWRGARGTAGEIGHIPIDPSGPVCPCGQRGCLEAVASGSGLARLWPTGDGNPAGAVFAAARAGVPAAIVVRDAFVANVAAAVRLLVLTIDVEHVVIGGGLSGLGAELLESVQGVLRRWERDSAFLASTSLSERVNLVPAGFPAAAVGAAMVGETMTVAEAAGG